jgi:mannan endo-1,4-beta-mannosidase
MIANWDRAARALSELQDAGVVVLWRPFHEFDGGWFWWGKGSPEDFIRLWRMMYKRFTDDFHLNNLIWVLGYSGEVREGWYVGDDFCDVIGSDTYDGSEHKNGWDKLLRIGAKNKPFAFHECGRIPSIQAFLEKDCLWSWFTIWHTSWAEANRGSLLREFYNDEHVLSLEDIQGRFR